MDSLENGKRYRITTCPFEAYFEAHEDDDHWTDGNIIITIRPGFRVRVDHANAEEIVVIDPEGDRTEWNIDLSLADLDLDDDYTDDDEFDPELEFLDYDYIIVENQQ